MVDLQSGIMTGRITSVEPAPESAGLVGDHAEGATTLTVSTGGMFYDVGMCRVGDDDYAYSRDGDTLIIADPGLIVAAEDGTPVTSLSPSGRPEARRVANVDLDGFGEPTIEALIPTGEHNYYPLGLVLSESLVAVTSDGGYGYVTAGRPMEQPLMDATGLDPETDVPGLQDAYDRADEAAAAAELAELTATTAQDSADGKNKVWYSLDAPGSTPNTAGDVWFRKDLATQGIIAQYEGLGGTSWASRQLRNEVIANLDAGKLTVGSAFTNALHVKTNFTLGDATTNGVIQSYNFAGSSVGVLIDKFGLVAKGGTIAGASIIGGTVEGAVVKTGSSGQRVEIRDVASSYLNTAEVDLYTGLSGGIPSVLSATDTGTLQLSKWLGASLSGVAAPYITMQTANAGGARRITIDGYELIHAQATAFKILGYGGVGYGDLTVGSIDARAGITSTGDITAGSAGVVTGYNIVANNRLRSMGTLGAWGSVGPSAQPARPSTTAGTTQAEIVAILAAYGLCA